MTTIKDIPSIPQIDTTDLAVSLQKLKVLKKELRDRAEANRRGVTYADFLRFKTDKPECFKDEFRKDFH